jgi:uncharacterized protein DUF695
MSLGLQTLSVRREKPYRRPAPFDEIKESELKKGTAVSVGWDAYLCRVNGELASICLDLDQQTDPSHPSLLWVWIDMLMPRPDGLSSREEADTLGKLEDVLTQKLTARLDARFVGRITVSAAENFISTPLTLSWTQLLSAMPCTYFRNTVSIGEPSMILSGGNTIRSCTRQRRISRRSRAVESWMFWRNTETGSINRGKSDTGFTSRENPTVRTLLKTCPP